MNYLLEKFSSAETINEAGQTKSLGRLVCRENVPQDREVVTRCETLLWKQKCEFKSSEKKRGSKHENVSRLIRKRYREGRIFINSSVPKEIDIELSLAITASLVALLNSTSPDGHLGVCLRFIDNQPRCYRVFPVDIQQELGCHAIRAKLGGQEVLLQGGQEVTITSKAATGLEV